MTETYAPFGNRDDADETPDEDFEEQDSVQLGNLTPEQVADDSDEGKERIQSFVRARTSRLDFDPKAYDVSVNTEGSVTAYRKADSDIDDVDVDMPDADGDNKHERDERARENKKAEKEAHDRAKTAKKKHK